MALDAEFKKRRHILSVALNLMGMKDLAPECKGGMCKTCEGPASSVMTLVICKELLSAIAAM
eukprot:12001519-Karenia_brevis.AAC.1